MGDLHALFPFNDPNSLKKIVGHWVLLPTLCTNSFYTVTIAERENLILMNAFAFVWDGELALCMRRIVFAEASGEG